MKGCGGGQPRGPPVAGTPPHILPDASQMPLTCHGAGAGWRSLGRGDAKHGGYGVGAAGWGAQQDAGWTGAGFWGCRVEMRDGAMQDGGVHGEVQDEGRKLGGVQGWAAGQSCRMRGRGGGRAGRGGGRGEGKTRALQDAHPQPTRAGQPPAPCAPPARPVARHLRPPPGTPRRLTLKSA